MLSHRYEGWNDDGDGRDVILTMTAKEQLEMTRERS